MAFGEDNSEGRELGGGGLPRLLLLPWPPTSQALQTSLYHQGQEVRKAMEGFPEGIKRKLSARPDWTENPPLRNALADLELWIPRRCLEGNPGSVAGRTLTCSLNYQSIL